MIGVIIAAGSGTRMRPLTNDRPKCMLPVGGRPLIESLAGNLRRIGCSRIVVIVGYRAEAVRLDGAEFVGNSDYRRNNILQSFMKARPYFTDEIIASYSDIWVEPEVFDRLVGTSGDIVAAVDRDWTRYYEGRLHHPMSEAENALFDTQGNIVRIGKHVDPSQAGELLCGEFIGLWRMTISGREQFVSEFDRNDKQLAESDQFQGTTRWINAYVTDMLQELVACGISVKAALVDRGWAELDTVEDFERLPLVADRQRLRTFQTILGDG